MEFDRMIFIFNGPSAGGKTTAMETLLDMQLDLEQLVTVTTRPPRIGEIEGKHYYFLTLDEFQAKKHSISGDAIVEESEYPKNSGTKYGIFDSELQRIQKLNKDAITVLDIHGISEIKRFYGSKNVVSIFVYRDLGEIYKELLKRNLPSEEVERRMDYAKKELLNMTLSDHIIYNIYDKQKLIDTALNIINEERKKLREVN